MSKKFISPTRVTIARPVDVLDLQGNVVAKGYIRDHDSLGDEVDVVTESGEEYFFGITIVQLQITGDPEIQFVILEIQ